MDYQIIATLGPAAGEHEFGALLKAGATAFRLNTSHLSLDALCRWFTALDRLFGESQPAPPLVLDLQGSKWRLGDFSAFTLEEGQSVEVICTRETRRGGALPVPHPDFFTAAGTCNGEIVLNDAKSLLRIEATEGDRIRARVIRGGGIAANKGITFTHSDYRKESLSDKDAAIVAAMSDRQEVRYALSYVKDSAEMASYRRQLGARHLIAKIERASALEDVPGIAKEADELWLCRGDLGAEMGLRAMAEAVRAFTARVPSLPVPTVLAGQVLEHMTEHATPTRSEMCYLHDALQAGFAGVVLSDETAVGRYPVEACRAAALFR